MASTSKTSTRAKPAARKSSARVSKSSYHHGNLREALVDAALALVEEKGPAGLTLRAAARKAGVSQAAPYRHFADKETLLAAVAEKGFHNMAAFMREACVPYKDDPLRRLNELGVSYVLFSVQHPNQFRVMFGPEVADKKKHADLHKAAQQTFSLLTQGIADYTGSGQAPAEIKTGKEAALAAWAIVHGLSSLIVDGQLEPIGIRKKDIEQVVRSVLASDQILQSKFVGS